MAYTRSKVEEEALRRFFISRNKIIKTWLKCGLCIYQAEINSSKYNAVIYIN
jgi:hypothetical protein